MIEPLNKLRQLLSSRQPGPICLTAEEEHLLADCWSDLSCLAGGMTGEKLHGRMEDVTWQPPTIVFRIERHGAMFLGSSRAAVQQWTVDLEQQTSAVAQVGHRQVCPMQPRLNVKPIAQELADAILAGRPDDRLKWDGMKRVRLLIGKVLPEGSAVRETLAARRKRLRQAVGKLLTRAGWHMAMPNVFEKLEQQ